MRILIGALLGIGLLAVIGLVVIYTGAYNVAATDPHSQFGRWLFATTMENSVRAHAQGITPPADLGQAAVESGFRHYVDNCAMCHGAPGVEAGEIGKGLTPEPPDLEHAAEHWEVSELFWIIKNGIKMTGMPAWSPSHSDTEIWQLAAFVRKLPEISATEYQRMKERLGGAHSGPAAAGAQRDPGHGDHAH